VDDGKGETLGSVGLISRQGRSGGGKVGVRAMEEGAARRYGDRAEDGLGAIEQLPRALAVAPALRDESEVSEGPSHIVLRPLALRRVQASLQLLAGLVHGPHLR